MSKPQLKTNQSAPPSSEDTLSSAHFDRIAALVQDKTGIRLPPSKRIMIDSRLRRLMRDIGAPTLADYCDYLFNQGGLATEETHLIDAATTNKTDFFREPDHFRFLAGPGIDALLALHRSAGRPRLKVWSAASSNGAEAFTAAIVLAEQVAQGRQFDFSVLGTDICTSALRQAHQAVYPADFIVPVPPAMRRRYFLEARDPQRRDVRIVPELRRCVRFAQLNLMDQTYAFDRDFDAIFLRNVLIYFEHEVQIAVTRRLMGHLRPGGYLFIGHSETSVGSALSLRQIGPATFQRV